MTLGYLGSMIAAACFAMLLAVGLDVNIRYRSARRAVFENLDSAAENGYFAPGEQLDGATAEEIVGDLRAYAEDPRLNDVNNGLLERAVLAWMHKRGIL